jgi:hypothetical protein
MTDGHFFTLSWAQAHALAGQLAPQLGQYRLGPGAGGGPVQWVQLAGGRWISEKDPGYPYLAVAFQALGLMRLAPLFYGALACLGLYVSGRRWLGRFGGAAAVGLYCSSGAAILFAWRDYMPTFTEASLIAAGTGALLWVVLAAGVSTRRRTWTGLAGFVALEAVAGIDWRSVVGGLADSAGLRSVHSHRCAAANAPDRMLDTADRAGRIEPYWIARRQRRALPWRAAHRTRRATEAEHASIQLIWRAEASQARPPFCRPWSSSRLRRRRRLRHLRKPADTAR